MHVLLIMALFNIHTGTLGSYKIEHAWPGDDWTECAKALTDTGPQKPDKDGNVKLYECVRQGDRPEVHFITEL